jgi:hypothetical protein
VPAPPEKDAEPHDAEVPSEPEATEVAGSAPDLAAEVESTPPVADS